MAGDVTGNVIRVRVAAIDSVEKGRVRCCHPGTPLSSESDLWAGASLWFDELLSLRENSLVASIIALQRTSRGRVARVLQSGPVAQLGARFHGMEEVVGSIPTRSTNYISFIINNLTGENPDPTNQPLIKAGASGAPGQSPGPARG